MGIKIIGYYDSEAEALADKKKKGDYLKGWVPYKVDSGSRSGSWSFKRDTPNPHEQRRKGKAIGGPIENPLEKKQNPLYREELGMYGGGAVRKKMYARGGGTRPTRG